MIFKLDQVLHRKYNQQNFGEWSNQQMVQTFAAYQVTVS